MRVFLVIAGILAVASAAPLGASGPVKISDNNIENIFNININIQGVFSNNIEQDIVNVVVGLLNQQGVSVGGATLKDQLMALAQNSDSKDMHLDVPVGQKFNLDGLANKIQEAIAKKQDSSETSDSVEAPQEKESSTSGLEAQAKEFIQKFMNKTPQLKL